MSATRRRTRPIRLVLALLVLATIAVAGGCDLGPKPYPESTGAPPARILEKGTVTVATAADLPPLSFKDKASGEIVGAEPELMAALAAEWGVEVEVVAAPRDRLLDLVGTGKADLAVGGIVDTVKAEPRQATFIDYFKPAVRIYTTAARGHAYPTAASLCDRSVAVVAAADKQLAELSATSCASIGRPAIRRVRVGSAAAGRQQLDQGRVDLVAQSAESYADLIKTQPGVYSGVLDPLPVGLFGVAVRDSDLDLVHAVLVGLGQVRESGTYDTILQRWHLGYGRTRLLVNGR